MQISQRVRVRGASWHIVDIRAYEACQLVTLARITPAQGPIERQVLEPFDDIEPAAPSDRARFARSGRWWRACRTLLAENTPPDSLRSMSRARIEIMPHQLEPALAVVRGLGSRVLLADEVGLGKTIQAGIVVSELRARGLADRVLVLAPAGLRDQWIQELEGRFGLEAQLADAPSLRSLSSTLPLGVSPWLTHRIAVASIDYVKRPEVLPTLLACSWDILVVDEAHASAGDSDRQTAVAAIGSRAAYVLLLTATPHSGDERSFASLCCCGAVGGDPLLVFRRRRTEVRIGARRKIHSVCVRSTPEELRAHALLARYVAAVRAEREGAWLAASVLHKRALSSAWSLARSVERRLDALSGSNTGSAGQLELPFENRDGEFTAADDEPEWPAGVGLSDVSREQQLLRRLLSAARSAAARQSKLTVLARLLRRAREPAVIFTEYRDTLQHVQTVLRLRAAVLHGGLARAQRAAAIADFVSGRCPVLLATDAGAEGLNLHFGCRLVVNLELPWNPMRLEQRIGRVDRIGQQRTVHAFHLIAGGTGERRILTRLKSRIARASAAIGAPDPVGAVEERVIARLIEDGTEDSPQQGLPPRSAVEGVPRVMPDLREQSQREAHRLAFARLLMARTQASGTRQHCRTPADVLDADGPLVCHARRAGLRRSLGARALTLWRIAYEDGYGRIVESTVLSLMIEVNPMPSRWTRRIIDNLHEQFKTAVSGCDQDRLAHTVNGGGLSIVEWREAAGRSAHALLSTRLSRERAIQSQTGRPPAAVIQAGLFDRRSERARLVTEATQSDADSERRDRFATLQLAAAISATPPQLLLVLLP